MGTINKDSLLDLNGPFTRVYNFYTLPNSKKVSPIIDSNCSVNLRDDKIECWGESKSNSNLFIGICKDKNLAQLLSMKQHKKEASIIHSDGEKTKVSIMFTKFKKYSK